MKTAFCSDLLKWIVIPLLLTLQCQVAFAEAGRVVFSYGTVTAKSFDGEVRALSKRSLVNEGDTIQTENRSMVQIRMIDKGFIALRANSEIRIDSYRLGADKGEDIGIFDLIKGGLRAITGIIGKRLRSSYKMRTVNATIGIRGTDYTARICNKDCNAAFGNINTGATIADGLYVGVNMGGIDLTNQLGTLALDELQFGYVKDATSAPVALLSAPEFLYFNSRPPNPDDDQASGSDEAADTVADTTLASRSSIEPASSDLTNDDTIRQELQTEKTQLTQDEIDKNSTLDQVAETDSGSSFSLADGNITSNRLIVTSYGKSGAAGTHSSVYSNPYSAATITSNSLTRFENSHIDGGIGVYDRATTNSIDLGYDPVTGIAWGRWYSGAAQFTSANAATSTLDMSSTSLHWITSPDQAGNIALPSTGSVNFNWVGNTSPTDNQGNSGILGSANLNANFNNMTVDTSVAVGINNQLWNASATALPISSSGTFSGNMDSVQVTTGNGVINGTGSAAGFFTNNANGAGLGFALEADIATTPTSVTGTAVFQK